MTDQSGARSRQDFPANNLPEFITYAKANQSRMQYSSAGRGQPLRLCAAQRRDRHRCHACSLSQRRAGGARDLLAGLGGLPVPERADRHAADRRHVGEGVSLVLSKNRSPSMPTLASAHEQGLTDFDIPSWYAFFLPKGTPDAIVQKLRNAMIAAMDGHARSNAKNRAPIWFRPSAGPRRSADSWSAASRRSVPIRASGVQIE